MLNRKAEETDSVRTIGERTSILVGRTAALTADSAADGLGAFQRLNESPLSPRRVAALRASSVGACVSRSTSAHTKLTTAAMMVPPGMGRQVALNQPSRKRRATRAGIEGAMARPMVKARKPALLSW